MILSHVMNALLSQSLHQTNLYIIIHFIEGFVAPSFMLASGAAFSIAIQKRKDDLLMYRLPAMKQTSRYLQIFIVAYLLHLPYKTFNQCQTLITSNEYLYFISIDVLQAIALGLIIIQFSFIIIRNEKIFYNFLLVVSLLIIAATPFVYQYDFAKIFPIELATYFNKMHGSNFPAFPWIAYVFLGCYISNILLKSLKAEEEGKTLVKFATLGGILIFLGAILELLSIQSTPYYDFWYTSPNIFMIRFGGNLIFLYLLWKAEKKYNYKMKVLGVFGLESLTVYIVHLLIVYGSVLGVGLPYYVGTDLGWVEMFVVFFAVSAAMLALALIWNFTKRKLPLFAKIVLFSTWLYFFYYFFTKPF
jgi:hypothetical protein